MNISLTKEHPLMPLKQEIIDGRTVDIPNSMKLHKNEVYQLRDGTLYALTATSAQSRFNRVWIIDGEKYVRLAVQIIGNQKYVEAAYYRHPADEAPYQTKKNISAKTKYKPYVEHILQAIS